MLIARTIEQAREAVEAARANAGTIGFVPTMGFLHEGHLSLIDRVRDTGADFVVVSIFVNPTQFGPNEDLDAYPRDEARDRSLLENRHVDVLFIPSVEVMYPPGRATRVVVGGVAEPLEGERRPGHFEGVATVVLKLFHIVRPDLAAFGRKDAQQCAVIAQMVRDLDIPVRLVFGETVREADGLALSSRNTYLSSDDRVSALALRRSLLAGAAAIRSGIADPEEVEQIMRSELAKTAPVELDYLRIVDPATFGRPDAMDRPLLLVGAVRVGKTRLIDNLPIDPNEIAGPRRR